MSRLVAIDTETTGLKSKEGDRIIEIAIVEITRDPNPRYFHSYFNPGDRIIPPEVTEVHGLTNEFLKDAPTFEERLPEILEFCDGSTQVIHNAPFDVGFLRDECIACDQIWPEFPVIDTLKEAVKKFPGSRHSLDALCNRFGVDITQRTKHGALIDAQLLGNLYLAWFGQAGFDLEPKTSVITKENITSLGALNQILVPVAGNKSTVALPQSWDDFFAKNTV
jgi:DNA polymerase-3 subunit epsilon